MSTCFAERRLSAICCSSSRTWLGWGRGLGQAGVEAGIGSGVQPRTPTPDPYHARELLVRAHQRPGPVGERLCEGLVADAHDAQLELFHRATAEGRLA
jgi:hypothetical protein